MMASDHHAVIATLLLLMLLLKVCSNRTETGLLLLLLLLLLAVQWRCMRSSAAGNAMAIMNATGTTNQLIATKSRHMLRG